LSGKRTICFSHGQESGPWGTKIKAMAEVASGLGWTVESVDYRGIASPLERTDKLIEHCGDTEGTLVLVGSSMGGHVATAASGSLSVAGLFLIAPAFFMPGHEELTPEPRADLISIVHGWADDIVPVGNSLRWASLHNADLHLIDGGHRLTERLDEILHLLRGFLGRLGSD
jgi:pimeloyl-ACP methyl ester carboxylesterase